MTLKELKVLVPESTEASKVFDKYVALQCSCGWHHMFLKTSVGFLDHPAGWTRTRTPNSLPLNLRNIGHFCSNCDPKTKISKKQTRRSQHLDATARLANQRRGECCGLLQPKRTKQRSCLLPETITRCDHCLFDFQMICCINGANRCSCVRTA